MAGEHVNELHQLYFAGRHNFLVNSNDGFYQRGKLYGMETKLFVAVKYLDHKERLGGLRPVLTKVAAEYHVGRDFVAKIEQELMENDQVFRPGEIYVARDNPIRPGSMSMSRPSCSRSCSRTGGRDCRSPPHSRSRSDSRARRRDRGPSQP
jgi:hypothetical protein